MAKIVLFNKPYQVLSQFTDREGRATLSDYIFDKSLHVAGRLDYDSEGLLLLTDSGQLKHQITHPGKNKYKTYLVQVEGCFSKDAIDQLRSGILLKDGPTLPAKAEIVEPPALWPRNPPIRERANIPTSWVQISIREGRNRQIRRMTAALGFPTLRLVRTRIDQWDIGALQPGQQKILTINLPAGERLRNRHRRSWTRR